MTTARPSARSQALFAFVALLMAACGGGSASSPAEGDAAGTEAAETGADDSVAEESADTIKIAAPLPLTGPAAAYGTSYLDGLELGVERINEAGGIAAHGGAQLELLVADDEANPERGPELIRQLQSQGAVAAVGPLTSAAMLATVPVFDEVEIPVVAPSVDTALTEQGSEYFFRIIDRAEAHGEQAVEFVQQQITDGLIDVDSVGIVSMDIAPGTSIQAVLEERFTELGIDTEVISYSAQGTRDFGPIVSQLREADVDLVLGHIGPGEAPLFVDAVALQDWRPSAGFLWIGGGFVINASLQAIGPNISNWMAVNFTAPQSALEINTELAAEYREATGLPFDALSGSAPAVVGALAAALETAEDLTGPSIRDALRELEYDAGENFFTMAGGVNFDEVGDNTAWRAPITQYDAESGEMVAVFPDEVALQEPRWPAHDAE